MTREEALRLIEELGVSPNIKKHLLANEAIMRHLAKKMEPNRVEDWGLAGLLHDADYEYTQKDPSKHPLVVAQKLREKKADQDIIEAILGHSNETGVERKTLMAKALYAGDNMAGLITAATLVRPDKKLEGLSSESILKRFKESSFAKGAKRDEIITCESELNINLDEFASLCLEAMKGVSDQLGL